MLPAERRAASAEDRSLGALRRAFPLNQGWLYDDVALPGSANADFDDSGFDDRDHQFVSVYRRHFLPPEVQNGSRIFVDFERPAQHDPER
jgi:hypothetical protein